MIINEMFKKSIDREYEGVIKVGQHENENLQQELEEYVVTDELAAHFKTFFNAYEKGIDGTTGKMGVWISGFFGSGKSHFLKMLSFLLENKLVAGRTAQEYFFEDNKITDEATIARMKKAAGVSTDAILFNIDSKSDTQNKRNKDGIVMVFLKVFNEMRGLASNPYIADIEQELIDSGKYEAFKAKYQELNKKHESWEASRHTFDFRIDIIVEALTAVGAQSRETARTLCDRAATGTYTISIEAFARRVRDYIQSRGDNHHVVFLVDEIGQYIGGNTDLMLNLQTVVEDLGTACQGKAWVAVTSQEDIDSITQVKGEDFSKIQGRFDTRLALSSANADEVIKKRILAKTDVAADTLRVEYSQKETAIKNLITFSGTALKKVYADTEDFVSVYPFVTYQFNLLGDVLTSIRTFGASGKHLSEGERSLLAMFKEAAIDYKDSPEGTLIPLSAFYNAMENFLDHSHRSVISKAYDNEHLNPGHKKQGVFVIDVLKVLFMLKYIKNYQADVDTLVSLMVTNVEDDRVEIKGRIEAALRKLKEENLIQQNGSVYVFLTDEEQDINKMINKQVVEPGELVKEVGNLIFNTVLTTKNYKYPKFNNRYTFPFAAFVDEQSLNANTNSALSVSVLTNYSDCDRSEAGLGMLSLQKDAIIVSLPDDISFMEEISDAKKINHFFQYDASAKSLVNYDEIRSRKSREMREHNERAKVYLLEALKEADIFINGSKASIKEKDFARRIDDALYRQVEIKYSKLSYIDTPMNEVAVKKALTSQAGTLLDGNSEANSNALQEVLRYIATQSQGYAKVSLKSVKDYFKAVPYGFVDDDIHYLVARLFKKGELSFFLNGEAVTVHSHDADALYNYITKKQYVEKLMLERKERISDSSKKKLRSLLKEVFDQTNNSEDEDLLMQEFQEACDSRSRKLSEIMQNYGQQPNSYPGYAIVRDFRDVLLRLKDIRVVKKFYEATLQKADDLLDFAEDIEQVTRFFGSNQKELFDAAKKRAGIFADNQTYITDDEVREIVDSINRICNMPKPYPKIKELPELTDRFNDKYLDILAQHTAVAQEKIASFKKQVMEELAGKPYKEQYQDKYYKAFEVIADKAEQSNSIFKVIACGEEARFQAERFLNDMSARDAALAAAQAAKKQPVQPEGGKATGQAGQPSPAPAPAVPRITYHNIYLSNVMHAKKYKLAKEEDVDAMVEDLRRELKKLITENIVYHVTL